MVGNLDAAALRYGQRTEENHVFPTEPGNCDDVWVSFGHLQLTASRATHSDSRGVHPLALHTPRCSPAPLHPTKSICTDCIVC